jgi:ribosomal protein S18 acetylase RimI-like enzyme
MMQTTLRPAITEDTPFCLRVYASTRADEMALVNWSIEQKDAFLLMQFRAQTEHYRLHYPTAEYQIIELGRTPIGRLITDRRPDEILLMDIALLPQYRRAGIGSQLLKDLMNEAEKKGVPLVLHVEFFNPAKHLYERLGFVSRREVNSVYEEMAWTPQLVLV